MEHKYKECQSCGMPLSKDRNRIISKNDPDTYRYCSLCYKDGAFTAPGITLQEMTQLVKGKLKEMGFPGFLAGVFAKRTSKLERWKK